MSTTVAATAEAARPAAGASRFGLYLTLLAGGALALAALGVTAGLQASRAPTAAPAAVVPSLAVEAAPMTAAAVPTAAVPTPVLPDEAAASAATAPRAAASAAARPARAARRSAAAAAACRDCGVVESVRAFQREGEATGLGAVAGGLVGGALGNRVGKGNGRRAMTVVGAVGGGLAGHEIEKHARSETWYEVRLRMDDGSLRTLTQKTAPAPGARIVVEGGTLRNARAVTAPAG